MRTSVAINNALSRLKFLEARSRSPFLSLFLSLSRGLLNRARRFIARVCTGEKYVCAEIAHIYIDTCRFGNLHRREFSISFFFLFPFYEIGIGN